MECLIISSVPFLVRLCNWPGVDNFRWARRSACLPRPDLFCFAGGWVCRRNGPQLKDSCDYDDLIKFLPRCAGPDGILTAIWLALLTSRYCALSSAQSAWSIAWMAGMKDSISLRQLCSIDYWWICSTPAFPLCCRAFYALKREGSAPGPPRHPLWSSYLIVPALFALQIRPRCLVRWG